MVTRGHFGGFPLMGNPQWVMTEGIRPYEAIFDMPAQFAKQLIETAGLRPLDLVIQGTGSPQTFKNLFALSIVPRENPHILGVRVADRRWLLDRSIILRRYNMRRNIGHKRVGNNAEPTLRPVVPDVWYWEWSLKDPGGVPPGAKWQPSDVLKDIMDRVVEQEKEATGVSVPGYTISDTIKKTDRKLPVESLQFDGKTNMAVQGAVGLFPEAGLYVDENGRYVIYSKIDGSEGLMVKTLGPEIVGGGHAEVVNMDNEMPRACEVFFTVESELRFDFIEPEEGQTVTRKLFSRGMTNKIAIPDYNLTVNGNELSQHSWADLDPVLTAWGTPPGIGGSRISYKVLQRAALPFLDLWAGLILTGARDPDKNWPDRVGALMAHWRRTFGIPQDWVARCLSMKARRVGIIDVESGSSGKAEAYCDHSFIGTQRSFFKDLQGNADLRYAIPVEGYPTGAQVPGETAPAGALSFTATSKAVPADVSIIDSDQGIIRVSFQPDMNHMFEAAMPGIVVRDDGQPYVPSGSAKNPRQSSPTFDAVADANQIPRLSGSWKLAVIISGVPASPNNEKQLYKVRVEPKDVQDLMPEFANKSVGSGKGPVWQIRINPGNDGMRALVRWLDSRASDIEALWGIVDKEPKIDDLILNFEKNQQPGGPQAASLNEVARAVSAAVFARFVERYRGSATGMINKNVRPQGAIQAVTHGIDARGRATTRMQMSENYPELDLLAMVDQGTKALLTKQPHPER